MTAGPPRTVTVFGGTGFLGRRVAFHLWRQGFRVRIASRHPDRGGYAFSPDDPNIELHAVDLHDGPSVASALAGAYGAVNAASLYIERGRETFHSVHVDAAGHLASLAQQAGVQQLIHVSGVGADPASPSLYIRKRGEGEQVVQAVFADAVLVRPTVMFGPDDAFLVPLLGLLRRLPIFPLFGNGLTRLQPVHVEDVAEAIAQVLQRNESHAITYECGGPRVYTYKTLVRTLAKQADIRTVVIPFPLVAWHAMAWACEMLPRPPITRNQVELMEIDNVISAERPGLANLGVSPRAIEAEVHSMAQKAEKPA